MAASRSTRVTRSTVGLNGLDENFCGRTLRNRSIAHPEEVVPQSLLRSRSPKKRPEPAPIQKGSGTKSGEPKQPASRESWVSPRKRGLSVSEKESAERDSVENSDKKSPGLLSPVLKKIKRYLRSEEPNGPEEESPSSLPKDPSNRRSSASDNETDPPQAKPSERGLLLDDGNQREVKNEPEEQIKKSVTANEVFNHQTVNGVGDEGTAALKCNDCEADRSNDVSDPPKELIVSENGSSLSSFSEETKNEKETLLDHSVPCTNSEDKADIQDHCVPGGRVPPADEPAGAPSTIRDSEEEVDVVGDSTAKERVSESSNSLFGADQERCVSGDPDSELSLSEIESPGSHAAAFSDTQEHRYTLRTSPRRPLSAKDSPSKADPPFGENGQIEEGKTCSGAVNGSLVNSKDIALGDNKQTSNSEKCPQGEPTRRPCEPEPAAEPKPPTKASVAVRPADDDEEEPDVYYFESDHLALKHNKDYQRLLQTISVLEAQRTQALQDLERLARHQREALADPVGFVEMLQKKINLGIPCPQRIVQLPDIAWDQYTTSLGNFEKELRNRKRPSRRIKLIFDKVGIPTSPQIATEGKDRESSSYSMLPQSDGQECSTSHGSQQVRGRQPTEHKPGTFNQLWTVEEQKKLEQLLLKFPPEEVESRRWQKIADELGNRTAKQVASRVQKYFIKLTKAGIPVPGRTPNLYMYSKKSSSKRQHALNRHLFRPSTFMTSHEPPVYMDEDDDHSGFNNRDLDGAGEDDISDEDDIPEAFRHLDEYKQLLELKKMKKQRVHQMQAESGFVQHLGFKCDNCETEPIQGVRWHCQDCPQHMSVDFCDSCSDCLYETELHKEDHHLQPIYKVETFLDRDYCMPRGTSYNYLDPNYFPANR
ncbi:ZZ-type zinc finger-containing protein 3 [Spea bombifrons]|uniref:ZZ-type zinc finger-containing protein 3 n=1 Tax=Spea bombifrons TaxID=233779 RepID=UPI0023491FD9|nr:ZZ-type zinc finger-containing protein 3 [Spea bombifrons]XP_053326042.1 ZZ-type zinc finger-containing protein 3 [Spea bombifrons]XP_053326043.1 ZZ-type zinc finger-containing protein 3 [Spea bombifrons]